MIAATTSRWYVALLLCVACKTHPLHPARPVFDLGDSGDITDLADPGEPPDLGCVPRTEVCNGVDDDCDGQSDEGCPRLVWQTSDYSTCGGLLADDRVAVLHCSASGGKPGTSHLIVLDLGVSAERFSVERNSQGGIPAYAVSDGMVAWLIDKTLFTLGPLQAAPFNHGEVEGTDPIYLSARQGVVIAQSSRATNITALDTNTGQRQPIDLSVAPGSLVHWRNQALFFYDDAGRLERCDPQSALCTALGSPIRGLNSMVVSPEGPMGLWHQDDPNNTLWTVDETTGERTLRLTTPSIADVVALRDLFAWRRGNTIEAKRVTSTKTIVVGQGSSVALTHQSVLFLTRSAGGGIALVERPLLDEEL